MPTHWLIRTPYFSIISNNEVSGNVYTGLRRGPDRSQTHLSSGTGAGTMRCGGAGVCLLGDSAVVISGGSHCCRRYASYWNAFLLSGVAKLAKSRSPVETTQQHSTPYEKCWIRHCFTFCILVDT